MNWKKTILYSAGLSLAFFMYFANFVAADWSIWAIREAAPLIRAIRAEYGHLYSQFIGHGIAFLVGTIATAAFIYPVRYAFPGLKKFSTSAAIITLPVSLVSAQGADLSISGIATVLQPIIGASLVLIPMAIAKLSTAQS